MEYILTIWLLWASGETAVLQAKAFPNSQACIDFALSFDRQVAADGVVASHWVCGPLKIKETRDA